MREAREAFGGVALLGALVWLGYVQFQNASLNQIQEPPALRYTRQSCLYAEPCREVSGQARFRLSISSQTGVGFLQEDHPYPIPIPLTNCVIWDDDNWGCESVYFRDYIGRKSGEWYAGDETLFVIATR